MVERAGLGDRTSASGNREIHHHKIYSWQNEMWGCFLPCYDACFVGHGLIDTVIW